MGKLRLAIFRNTGNEFVVFTNTREGEKKAKGDGQRQKSDLYLEHIDRVYIWQSMQRWDL